MGHLFLDPVQALTSFIDGAFPVTHDDILKTGGQEQLYDGNGGRARAAGDDPDFLFLLADHLQGVHHTGQCNNGGAVLVIMENRDIAYFLKPALDLKASGSGNILQVNTAKGSGNQGNGTHDLVYILALNAQREGIYITKGLEEDTFAFHNGHAGLRTDVSQSQDRCSVRNDRAQIVTPCKGIRLADVFLDGKTGLRHAGCIGKGQIIFGRYRNGRDDLYFPAPFFMKS